MIAENYGYPHEGLEEKTVLSKIIFIPDSVPIDYMHNILEGVSKFLFTLNPYKSKCVFQALDARVEVVQLPHEFRRKFRKIS